MDSATEMTVFVKVVETGGFSAAARELGMPKSSVSRHVSRLEDRLGARLLHRTTRSLRPTEVGTAFYARAARIVQEIAEAEAAVTELHAVPRGTLRVAAPLTFGHLFLGGPIASFLARWPEITVEVDLADRMVDLIDEGYDVAVRTGKLPDSSLVARRLGTAERVVVASPAYLAAHGTPGRPEDLAEHECLLYAYEATTSSWRLSEDVTVPVTGRLTSNNGDILAAAAVAGQGVAMLPRFMVGRHIHAGRLVSLLQEFVRFEGGVYAIYPHHRHLSAKVRAFVDHLVEAFQPAPWECCEEQG